MADIMTPGNRLYLYRMLAQSMGFGVQVPLSRVEEIFADDDVQAQDMEFQTVRAVLESPHFQGIVKVEVFKKGRILVTLLHSVELDGALEALAKEKDKDQLAAKQPKGKKAYKQAKLKPSKPGDKRRRQEAKEAAAREAAEAAERERLEAEKRAEEERLAAEQKRLAEEEAARAAAEAAERAAAEEAARKAQEQADRELAANARRAAAERRAAGVVGAAALRITYDPYAEGDAAARVDAGEGAGQAAGASVAGAPAADAAPAVAPAPREPRQASSKPEDLPVNGMSAHTAALVSSIDDTPERVVKRAGKSASTQAPLAAPAAQAGVAQPQDAQAEARANEGRAVWAPVNASEQAAPAAPSAPAAAPAAPMPEPAPAPAPAPAVASPVPAPAPASPFAPETPQPSAAPEPARVASYADYPASISRDVYCNGALLGVLTRILPIQVDLMALLDEDWRVARATGLVSGNRSRATFPLRYLQEDGEHPVEITIRRASRGSAGSRWEVALIDGDDGTSTAHEAAGLEGLPLADEGAWDDLSTTSSWRPQVTGPARELAQWASIGTWDALLGELARTAAPERWSYPESLRRASTTGATRYGVLREYFTVTFHQAQAQGRVLVAPGGTFAAFNTGLVTPSLEDIFACFEPAPASDIPWRFVGFAQGASGELGRRITSELAEVPQAPAYLTALDDVVPRTGARLALDYRAILGDGLRRLPRGFMREHLAENAGMLEALDRMSDASLTPAERFDAQQRLARFIADVSEVRRRLCRALDDAAEQAMRACQRSYRVSVPVFDPQERRIKLLLPLCLVSDRTVDVALVVEPQLSGACQGVNVITLPRAYACARVISAEQPSWLSADRVLA